MKKLKKNYSKIENNLIAYACNCSCGVCPPCTCTCPTLSKSAMGAYSDGGIDAGVDMGNWHMVIA